MLVKTLTFDQISDSRFSGSEEELKFLSESVLYELSLLMGISVKVDEVRVLKFSDDDGNTIQSWRQMFYVQKVGRMSSWNDVFEVVNNVKAPYYNKFIRMDSMSNLLEKKK